MDTRQKLVSDTLALAGVAQWIEHRPANWKFVNIAWRVVNIALWIQLGISHCKNCRRTWRYYPLQKKKIVSVARDRNLTSERLAYKMFHVIQINLKLLLQYYIYYIYIMETSNHSKFIMIIAVKFFITLLI